MKRTIIGTIIGSLIGGITFLPPAIPVTLSMPRSTPSNVINGLFWLLPLIGLIIGGVLGGFVGKNRISLTVFKDKSLSIFWWCVWIFGLLGIEIGFVLSPITMLGLGNTFTPADLWILAVWLGIAGAFLGAIVGLLILAIYLPIKQHYVHKIQTAK